MYCCFIHLLVVRLFIHICLWKHFLFKAYLANNHLYIFVEAFQLKHFSSRNLAIAAEDASGIREEATTGEERGEERADAPSVTKGEVCGEAADTGEEIAEGPGSAR